MKRNYKIAVIPGDGIGKEVMPEGIRALERAAGLYGFDVEQTWHDFACCDYYQRHGPRVKWVGQSVTCDCVSHQPRYSEVGIWRNKVPNISLIDMEIVMRDVPY
jgi:hypothetical protein